MVARLVNSVRLRAPRFARGYNGQQFQGPHKTYFQQPPPQQQSGSGRRVFRTILLGTTCLGLGAYGHSWFYDIPLFGFGLLDAETAQEEENLMRSLAVATQDAAARQTHCMGLENANDFLKIGASFSTTVKAVGHLCTLPSNMPCEDMAVSGVYGMFNDPQKDWCTWSIYDGHAGPRMAQVLKDYLPLLVGGQLWEHGCMDRSYVPNDAHIVRNIKDAFVEADRDFVGAAVKALGEGGRPDRATVVSVASAAFAGSCALLALFDPAKSVLRVANTGDSRAVLGRWDDEAGKYVAVAMSHDQTGFNEVEVERLNREHPGEDPVDPKTGRVFGLAVSRAFGDARWKWANELTQRFHQEFWGPAPRPNGVIKTPPYLTAEPEVIETQIQTGKHPDFLIMASDGLWDNMSSEDAVTCVQQWLDKFNPTNFLSMKPGGFDIPEGLFARKDNPSERHNPNAPEDEDTYWDEGERALKWRVSPKHFVVEDENCGVHLIKNALGGNRRNLFCGVMSVQPPHSRNVRDDITVNVVFFGVDGLHLIDTSQ